MKTQLLIRIFQHIHKCHTIEEVTLAILMHVCIIGMEAVAIKLSGTGTSLKFITKAVLLVQSSFRILPTFDLSKQQQ
jgi:hypothetical protein